MSRQLKKLLIKNLVVDVRTRIGPGIIKQVMSKFEVELIGKVTLKDPSAPEHFKDDFFSMLSRQLESDIIITDSNITFFLGDKEELGYSGVINSPLQTMVFIIEGILGEYAFISRDIYSSVRPSAEISLGRWSGGFLITKEAFFKEGWSKKVSWEKARWGFSNTGPINVFDIDNSFISEMIDYSIKRTINEFASIIRSKHGKK